MAKEDYSRELAAAGLFLPGKKKTGVEANHSQSSRKEKKEGSQAVFAAGEAGSYTDEPVTFTIDLK